MLKNLGFEREKNLDTSSMPKISSHWPLNFKTLQLNACTSNAGDCQNLQACTFIVFSTDILTVIDLTVLSSQL